METRPKINLNLTSTDRIIEIAGWLALAFIWIITLFHYRNLPDTIPSHFNVAGQADGFGPKTSIFILPVLGTILFIGLTILNRFPQVFNYPVKLTPENVANQYMMATRLIRYLKLAILAIFAIILWLSSYAAIHQTNSIGIWLLPTMMIMIFVPIGYYIYKSFRNK
jgi:uncharacterized membrane protein